MDKYLSRSIDQTLQERKDNPRRKPLLVRGARQVGKSSTIRHLSSYGEQSEFTISNLFQAPHIIQHTDRRR